LFHYLEDKAENHMVQQLDKQSYQESELVEIKVPLNLPYAVNWKSFERYDGSIDIDGKHYNYVKRKIYNNTLILLCIPNDEKTKVSNSRNQYAGLVNDVSANPGKKSGTESLQQKQLTAEYDQNLPDYALANVNVRHAKYFSHNDAVYSSSYLNSILQPPDSTTM